MKSMDRLLASLRRLPGVGPKQAERLALHLLRAPISEVSELSAALLEAKTRIGDCGRCQDLSEGPLCRVCEDATRDRSLICVVENPMDVAAVERSGSFKGFYHVLHGALSPIEGVGPQALRMRELTDRLKAEPWVREVIVATDPDTEGEATALYLGGLLRGLGPKVTRIAHGVPLGGDLEYTDEGTLAYAITGRREL